MKDTWEKKYDKEFWPGKICALCCFSSDKMKAFIEQELQTQAAEIMEDIDSHIGGHILTKKLRPKYLTKSE